VRNPYPLVVCALFSLALFFLVQGRHVHLTTTGVDCKVKHPIGFEYLQICKHSTRTGPGKIEGCFSRQENIIPSGIDFCCVILGLYLLNKNQDSVGPTYQRGKLSHINKNNVTRLCQRTSWETWPTPTPTATKLMQFTHTQQTNHQFCHQFCCELQPAADSRVGQSNRAAGCHSNRPQQNRQQHLVTDTSAGPQRLRLECMRSPFFQEPTQPDSRSRWNIMVAFHNLSGPRTFHDRSSCSLHTCQVK
jgi:hypothetical protein